MEHPVNFDLALNSVAELFGEFRPGLLIMAGTGIQDNIENMLLCEHGRKQASYNEIPGFPIPANPSHCGELHWGLSPIEGELRPIVISKGRIHFYDLGDANATVMPVRVMAALGVKHAILTGAVGSSQPNLAPGKIVAVTGHVNLTGTGLLFTGEHDKRFGKLFPGMGNIYNRNSLQITRGVFKDLNYQLREAVTMFMPGRRIETAAEMALLAKLGIGTADMSLPLEAEALCAMGVKVIGLQVVGNFGANLTAPDTEFSDEDVQRVCREAAPALHQAIKQLIEKLS